MGFREGLRRSLTLCGRIYFFLSRQTDVRTLQGLLKRCGIFFVVFVLDKWGHRVESEPFASSSSSPRPEPSLISTDELPPGTFSGSSSFRGRERTHLLQSSVFSPCEWMGKDSSRPPHLLPPNPSAATRLDAAFLPSSLLSDLLSFRFPFAFFVFFSTNPIVFRLRDDEATVLL